MIEQLTSRLMFLRKLKSNKIIQRLNWSHKRLIWSDRREFFEDGRNERRRSFSSLMPTPRSDNSEQINVRFETPP